MIQVILKIKIVTNISMKKKLRIKVLIINIKEKKIKNVTISCKHYRNCILR